MYICVCMLMSVCLYMNKCLCMHARVTCLRVWVYLCASTFVFVHMRIACHHAHSVMYVFIVCAHPLSANVHTCSAVLCVRNVCAVCVCV